MARRSRISRLECLNGGYWKGAPLMRATHLFAIANRVIE
jgi:hypothetical protein